MAQRVKADLNVYQGDTRNYRFTFFTDTAMTIPWDLHTATQVRLTVKPTLDATAELFHSDATDGANGNNWTGGIVVISIASTDSVKLTKNGKYDLQATFAGGPVTPVYGDVLVQKQVTP